MLSWLSKLSKLGCEKREDKFDEAEKKLLEACENDKIYDVKKYAKESRLWLPSPQPFLNAVKKKHIAEILIEAAVEANDKPETEKNKSHDEIAKDFIDRQEVGYKTV